MLHGVTMLPLCLVSGAESRRMFPWHGAAGRKVEAFSYICGCVSSPLSVTTASVCVCVCFVFPNHHAHRHAIRQLHLGLAFTIHWRHKQAMTTQSYVCLYSLSVHYSSVMTAMPGCKSETLRRSTVVCTVSLHFFATFLKAQRVGCSSI